MPPARPTTNDSQRRYFRLQNVTRKPALIPEVNGYLITSQIHALVAKGTTILAEHQAGKRDFSQGTPLISDKGQSLDNFI